MTTVSNDQWQSLRASFLQRYPDFVSFNQPGADFAEKELNHKRAVLKRFSERGVRERLPVLVHNGNGQEAVRELQRVNFGNLISAHYFWSIQFGRTDEQACTVLQGLLETAKEPYQGPDTLRPLLEATRAAGTKSEWDVLKILWLFRPQDYFPVGISLMRTFASKLGVALAEKQRFSLESYPPLRDFVVGFQPLMEEWKPADLTDVQSVVWDMAHHETNNGEQPPEEEVAELVAGRDEPARPAIGQGVRMWVIGAGLQAKDWEEWQRDGYAGLGWHIGDVEVMATKRAVQDAMEAADVAGGMNIVNALFQFCHDMREGDYLFVKQGRSRLMGWGIIASAYRSDAEASYPHRRAVRWMSSEVQNLAANSLPTKTLTLIPPHRPMYRTIWDAYRLSAVATTVAEAPPKVPRRYTREDALRDLFMPSDEVDKILLQLRRRKNVILQGPPGVGKTFIAKRLAFLMMEERASERVKMVQFHQSYSYEDFIQGFRPCENGSFTLHYGHFYDFCKRAETDDDNDYFFIIDEINRGNLSKIFGELLMLLEHDKRGSEHSVGLAYSSGDADEPEEFSVPENVHVIGTMNTADKSLALVDFAMRRRFAFVSLRPQFEDAYQRWMTQECGAPEDFVASLVGRVKALNDEIGKDRQLGLGSCIGHSFFTPDREDPPTDWHAWLKDVVQCEVEPLLLEYWPEDPDRVKPLVQAMLE